MSNTILPSSTTPDAVVWLDQPTSFAAQPFTLDQVNPSLQTWITLTDSMTAALADHFGGSPSVAVYYSGRCELQMWERDMIGATDNIDTCGYARHILLSVGATPVLAARSVTQIGNSVEPLLSELQQTPLARVLFEDPQWQREGDPIPLRHPPHTGRACTWLHIDSGDRLLVEEFFLF